VRVLQDFLARLQALLTRLFTVSFLRQAIADQFSSVPPSISQASPRLADFFCARCLSSTPARKANAGTLHPTRRLAPKMVVATMAQC
jgi:hypothetical protein